MNFQHTPVMLDEVLAYLNPQPGQYFIDCTLGGGGYTFAIVERIGKTGKIISFDLDEVAIKNSKRLIDKNKYKNIILINDNFKNLSQIIKEYFKKDSQTAKFVGIVFDLGLSQAQLQDRHRGFSFQLDGPLDMSFAHKYTNDNTEYIVNNWKQEELEKIIREYGEERFARKIAEEIVKTRKNTPIKTTKQLVGVIKKAVPTRFAHGKPRRKRYLYSKIHPATRTFQALRIATNNELENLKQVLPQAVDLLESGGRIAVISYHSLEDRIVKNFFKQESKDCICSPDLPECSCQHKAKLKIITKKVKVPTVEEIARNPRARSAKLRVAEKL